MNPFEPPSSPQGREKRAEPANRQDLKRAVRSMQRTVRICCFVIVGVMLGFLVLPVANPFVRWGLVAVSLTATVIGGVSVVRVLRLRSG